MGFVKNLEQILFPPHCLSCKKDTPEEPAALRWLCLECHQTLIPRWQKSPYKPEIDESYYIFDYKKDHLAKKIIHALKYSFVKEMAEVFGVVLEREQLNLKKLGANVIVPVPLHARRLRERGFNQSALIAEKISALAGAPVREGILIRKSSRRPQAEIRKRAEREKNTKGIFECVGHQVSDIRGKTILLVDDVATTGATLKECARVLKNAGAAKVISFTLAQD